MMTLLKALWKLRPPGEPETPGGRLVRRWREKRLLARLERDWPAYVALDPPFRAGDAHNLLLVPERVNLKAAAEELAQQQEREPWRH